MSWSACHVSRIFKWPFQHPLAAELSRAPCLDFRSARSVQPNPSVDGIVVLSCSSLFSPAASVAARLYTPRPCLPAVPRPADCGFGAPPCRAWGFCCNAQQLTAVPIDWIGPNASYISLEQNLIATLPNSFPPEMVVLTLRQNRLTTLPKGFGVSKTRLLQLDLSLNWISAFPPGAFVGMTSLTVLYLMENHLTTVNTTTFNGLPAINTLDLAYNWISAIDVDAFQGHEGLITLILSSNRLTVILPGTVDTLTALQFLSLANNQLISIPPKLLWYCQALHTVDLEFNRIARYSWLGLE